MSLEVLVHDVDLLLSCYVFKWAESHWYDVDHIWLTRNVLY